MKKRRITAAPAVPNAAAQPSQKTTLWNFFGNFWRMLSEQKREQDEIHKIEHLTFEQLKGTQKKTQLRLKR